MFIAVICTVDPRQLLSLTYPVADVYELDDDEEESSLP